MSPKYCPGCETVREDDTFYSAPQRPDGKDSLCKVCRKDINSIYYNKHKGDIARKNALYYFRNRKAISARSLKYYYDNKDMNPEARAQ